VETLAPPAVAAFARPSNASLLLHQFATKRPYQPVTHQTIQELLGFKSKYPVFQLLKSNDQFRESYAWLSRTTPEAEILEGYAALADQSSDRADVGVRQLGEWIPKKIQTVRKLLRDLDERIVTFRTTNPLIIDAPQVEKHLALPPGFISFRVNLNERIHDLFPSLVYDPSLIHKRRFRHLLRQAA